MRIYTCANCCKSFRPTRSHVKCCSWSCRLARRETDEQYAARFWSNVDQSAGEDACWPWMGSGHRGDYGQVNRAGSADRTHRVAYRLTNGEIPGGLFVCHRCDNPPCCNPRHLFAGTVRDNLMDARAKGLHSTPRKSGEENGSAKLTTAAVLEIRARYAKGGILQREIAVEYGVTQVMVGKIIRRENWAHV